MTVALRKIYDDEQEWPAPVEATSRFSNAVLERITVPKPRASAPTTKSQPSWVIPTRNRAFELVRLGDNWDRRGSAEVKPDALEFAWTLLSQSMPPAGPAPSMIPLGHGGVQLEWHNQNGDLEIEVVRPNEVVVYFVDKKSGREAEFPLKTEFYAVAGIMRRMFDE